MSEVKTWLLVLLTIFLPPVGTLLICTDSRTGRAAKVCAVIYCAAMMLAILMLRLPCCEVSVSARPLL